jgi:threonine dehydrogenase-like Zn-dependent dehydrogenase
MAKLGGRCMKGVVFLGDRRLGLMDFPDPTPGPDEVVLEIKASGMCGSDLRFYRASSSRDGAQSLGLGGDGNPVIAGHEPCGIVAARGSAVPEALAPVGARVMCHHYSGCGICPSCRAGWAQLCADGIVVYGITGHGAHSPYMKVPAKTLVPLPDALSYSEGAAISCGTGTAFGAIKRMHLTGAETLAVFGQGPVGLSATLLANAMGARVLAVDVEAKRLALAEDFGANAVVDASRTDPIEALRALTGGRGVDMAMDCSGHPQARVQAVRATKTWGTVCYVGEGNSVTLDVSQDMLRKQLTLLGSWTFSSLGQGECAAFVAERGIALDRIFTHRYKLEDAEQAYTLFDTQTTGKGVFEF